MRSRGTTSPHRAFGERLEQVLFAMYRGYPFFAVLAEPCMISVDDSGEIPTACVDERGRITLHPAFIDTLSDLQFAFVLAHEVCHVAFGHFQRRGSRDPFLWNVANDLVINALLRDSFGREDAMPSGVLWDPSLAGLTSEQIYQGLLQHVLAPRGSVLSSDMVEAGRSTGTIIRQPRGSLPAGDGWVAALAKAAAQARQFGNLPDAIARELTRCLRPKVDWPGQLRQFLRHGVSRDARADFTFIPCNRRFVHVGCYLPSLFGPSAARIVFAVDTSGSMGEADLAAAHAEIDSIRRQFGCPVYVMSADNAVRGGQWVLPHEELPTPVGGGLTDFRPVFHHLEEHRIKADVVVYMTDGYGTFGDPPSIETIWVMTTHQRPPWGHFVQIGVDA